MPMNSREKFSRTELEDAINRLKLLKFFPTDPGAHAALFELLAKICPHREALEWLVTTLQDHVPEWPGAQSIRGLLCTKYDAADGVDEYCNIPGFRPQDCEARYYEQHEQVKTQERIGGHIGEWHGQLSSAAEAKKLPPGRAAQKQREGVN